MKRGLVIGKFMPVHEGHISLINFALLHCDEVIVSMSFTEHDPINPDLRFSWMNSIFQGNTKIKLGLIRDDFDDETLPLAERTKVWADVIRVAYPHVDFIFSSEAYGEPFARHCGAKHISFDPARSASPVSASLIRQNPLKFWSFIPEVVKPYFVKKFCFYGPESTGKSTMSQKLAAYYETEYVPEVAREMVFTNDFTVEDIINIGKAQTQRVKDKVKTANQVLFCDSDLITTQIYSQHYLKQVPQILFDLEKEIRYDHYFLFDIDVPWVADGLRDLGHNRQEMYDIFKYELIRRNIAYTKIRGTFAERESTIKAFVDNLIA